MKIAHITDTHIRNLKYHDDYRFCFKQMYEILREQKVDYIVHCGDIAHTKTQISPEFVEMASDFFSNLSEIAPTYLILGNHDGNLKNSNRQDALTPIVQALNKPNLHLLKNSGETKLPTGNITLNVLSVFDRDNWILPTDMEKINIALYHGSITNCKTDAGWTMEHGEDNISIFEKFDFAMLGDIHKRQFLDDEGRVYYAGSTVQQNHGEDDDKGFSIWNIDSKDSWSVKHYTLKNPRPFVTIELTPSGKIPSKIIVPKNARLRLVSNNSLPLDIMRKAVDIAKHNFKPQSVSFLNRAAGKRGDVEELSSEFQTENLRDPEIQQEMISEYLKDYQVRPDTLSKIYELNSKYNTEVESKEDVSRNVNWKLCRFEWSNLFNYGANNSIDFNKTNGIVGIFGKNFSGKSSIIDAILFTMFNTTSKNERKNVNVVNQSCKWGEGKLLIKVENKEYTIHRKVTKYTKKTKEGTTTEAKTDLNFSVYDNVLQKKTILNGITRNQTDANIRRQFGTIDDFLLSSVSSQHGALSFINEGPTKRKEIIAKFLDLEFFDKKFKLGKKDSMESKALVKKLQGRDYDKEVLEAQAALDGLKKAILTTESEEELLKKELSENQALLFETSQKISDVPAEPIDINVVQFEIMKVKNALLKLSDGVIEDSKALIREKGNLDKITSSKDELDYESLILKNNEIRTVNKDIATLASRLEIALDKNKLLEDIPCGSSYPKCKFICDAHKASINIPTLKASLDELNERLELLNPEENRFYLNKFQVLVSEFGHTQNLIKDLELEIEKKRRSVERHNGILSNLCDKKEKYNNNKEAIENLEMLIKRKTTYAKQIKHIEEKIRSNSQKKIDLYKSLGHNEQRIENIEKAKIEFQNIQTEYSAFDLFLRCMHPNGIAYDIIKQKLPVINEEMAKILSNVVDFEIFFETSGNKFDIFIKHPEYEPRPIEMASGAEKSMAAMAIRLALLSVSSLPKGDIFVLDEPGTALDEENMAGFIGILELIKVYFKNVLLISHLDSLKDSVDMQIVIEKQSGFAKVKQ